MERCINSKSFLSEILIITYSHHISYEDGEHEVLKIENEDWRVFSVNNATFWRLKCSPMTKIY